LLFVRHEWIRVILTQFSAYMHWFIEGGVHDHVTILVNVDVFILLLLELFEAFTSSCSSISCSRSTGRLWASRESVDVTPQL
jgi:hypothetical protein